MKDKESGKEKKDLIKNILAVMPIRYYDEELDCFALEDGSFLDILHVIPRDLQNLAEEEIKIEMYNFIKFLRTIGEDITFISINFPLNTSVQRNILKHHLERADDSVKVLWINRQIEELETVESFTHTLNFFLIYYGENEKEFIKHKELLSKYSCTGVDALCENISKYEKIQIATKICNMNTTIDIHYYDERSEGEWL